MDRISGPGATPDNQFTEGDPALGVPATTVTANWLNGVQEELIHILTEAGITPDEANDTQIFAALVATFRKKSVIIGTNDIDENFAYQRSDGTNWTPQGPPIFERKQAGYPITMRDGVIRARSLNSAECRGTYHLYQGTAPAGGWTTSGTRDLATFSLEAGLYLMTFSYDYLLWNGSNSRIRFQVVGELGEIFFEYDYSTGDSGSLGSWRPRVISHTSALVNVPTTYAEAKFRLILDNGPETTNLVYYVNLKTVKLPLPVMS